ncbi:MAG TPA: nicotinate-nucleotide--dimethylbenzimidazole phosphoribosyltransferase [Acidobacteriota bacterium]|nr:nicotinate-nucleotide--dimethylbenzimidazole phosphoribosyltransferase [Acidobacteriota bacterium]
MKTTLEETLRAIQPVQAEHLEHYRDRLDQLTKPRGSLGRLEEVAARFGAIRHPRPHTQGKVIFTFAADHGVARQGVSLYPSEVTAQMVRNFLAGGAAINVLCRHYGIRNVVVDVGVDADLSQLEGLRHSKVARGTQDLSQGQAMTRRQALRAMQVGIDLAQEFAEEGFHLMGTGEMGIGNTTASSAVFSALSGLDPDKTTGAGTGIDQQRRRHKVEVIRQSLQRHRPDPSDPLEVLSAVGGFEIAAIAGLILGGAALRSALVVDGFISTAGAALALAFSPTVGDYLFFSHCSNESGHARVLRWLGVRPLLDLDLRLGEGTGAAIAIDLVEASWKLLCEMATFGEAAVSQSS